MTMALESDSGITLTDGGLERAIQYHTEQAALLNEQGGSSNRLSVHESLAKAYGDERYRRLFTYTIASKFLSLGPVEEFTASENVPALVH